MSRPYPLRLEPLKGDGYLRTRDVDYALDTVPHGAEVVVTIDETRDFSPDAPGHLARRLSGSVVTLAFGRRAVGIESHWRELHERAATEFLSIEASHLQAGG